jgi:hypothetical protein
MTDKHSGLKADFKVFESQRSEWLREHEGKYVVLHNGQVAGFFDDYATGLRAGITRFGPKTEFLIQQVCAEEPVFVIYWIIVAFHQLSFSPYDLQKDGPRIRIEISAPSFDVQQGRDVGLEYPPPFGITAVIDTGASLTVINPQVATTCKLRTTGFATVASVEKFGKYPTARSLD